jgi:hypothetical protein
MFELNDKLNETLKSKPNKTKCNFILSDGLTTKQHDNILNFYYYYNSIIFKDINYHLLFLSFSTFGQTTKKHN